MNLILITSSYPFSEASEQTFLNQEIGHLIHSFKRVIIIPQSCNGLRFPVSSEAKIDESYYQFRKKFGRLKIFLKAIKSQLFWSEIISFPVIIIDIVRLRRLLYYVGCAEIIKTWIYQFFNKYGLNPEECFFYSYWFDYFTTGVCLIKKTLKITAVTRAHGADLYEERYKPAYIPCRVSTIKLLDGIFPDSEKGVHYLAIKYAGILPLCEISRLGVDKAGFINSPSKDKSIRIVSCSFMVPIKRIELIIQGLAEAAHLRPDQQFIWHHFGDGPIRNNLEDYAKILPLNVTWHMPGYPGLEKLMEHYQYNSVDIFINVSASEGTPVAIMEAISCSIPVIATSVGGNTEIVNTNNGILLHADPLPSEIAESILWFVDHHREVAKKRIESYNTWFNYYNSSITFPEFIAKIKVLKNDNK